MAKTDPDVTVTSDTGIYQDATVHPKSIATAHAKLKALATMWRGSFTLDGNLERIRDNVARAQNDPREHIQKTAQGLLKSLNLLDKAIAERNVRAAAFHGIRVGMLDEKLQIRAGAFEAHVMHARRVKSGLAIGRTAKVTATTKRDSAISEWVAVQIKTESTRPKAERAGRKEIYELAASKFDVSLRTVERALGIVSRKK